MALNRRSKRGGSAHRRLVVSGIGGGGIGAAA